MSQQGKTGLPGDPSGSVTGNLDHSVSWSDRQWHRQHQGWDPHTGNNVAIPHQETCECFSFLQPFYVRNQNYRIKADSL